MVSLNRASLAMMGVCALAIAAPVRADEQVVQPSTMAELMQPTVGNLEVAPAIAENSGLEMEAFLTGTAAAETAQSLTPTESAQTLDEYLAAPAAMETAQVREDADIAQVTRPLYRGVAPFYLGVGGNLGLISSDKSATGDFGFNIISKVSFGPRFSLRPMLQFSEEEFNVTLPITYNFNPLTLGGFSFYPSAGGGVDFGSDIGFLVNAGVDVPISRDFTLNSQVNWRVTEDTGLGISFGVGYNFPVFFE